MKYGHQCKSADAHLSNSLLAGQVQECAIKCNETDGCKYFYFGNKNNGDPELCKWEKTTDSTCPEGWRDGSYDFYELIGKF